MSFTDVQNIGNDRTPENSAVFTNAGITDSPYNVVLNGDKGKGDIDYWYNLARTDANALKSCGGMCAGAVVKSIDDTRSGDNLPGKFYEVYGVSAWQNPLSLWIKPNSGVAVTIIGQDANNPCTYDQSSEIASQCKGDRTDYKHNYKYYVQKNCAHAKYKWDNECMDGGGNVIFGPTSAVGAKYGGSQLRRNQLLDCNVASGIVNFDLPKDANGKDCKAMCMKPANKTDCAAAVESYCQGKLNQGTDIRNLDICKETADNMINKTCTGAVLDTNPVCKGICTANIPSCKEKIKAFCLGANIQTGFCTTVLASQDMHGQHNSVMETYCTTDATGMNSNICKCINVAQFIKDVDATYVNRTQAEKDAVKARPDCFYTSCTNKADVYRKRYNADPCPPMCINNIGTLVAGSGNTINMSNNCKSTTVNAPIPPASKRAPSKPPGKGSGPSPAPAAQDRSTLLLYGGGGMSLFLMCICCCCCLFMFMMMSKRRR